MTFLICYIFQFKIFDLVLFCSFYSLLITPFFFIQVYFLYCIKHSIVAALLFLSDNSNILVISGLFLVFLSFESWSHFLGSFMLSNFGVCPGPFACYVP